MHATRSFFTLFLTPVFDVIYFQTGILPAARFESPTNLTLGHFAVRPIWHHVILAARYFGVVRCDVRHSGTNFLQSYRALMPVILTRRFVVGLLSANKFGGVLLDTVNSVVCFWCCSFWRPTFWQYLFRLSYFGAVFHNKSRILT